MTRSVLIVDDYEDSLELLSEALTREGFVPLTFRDPIAALLVLNEVTPGLILLDWHLPRLGGSEFVRQVRRRAHLREVPIVVVTGDMRVSSISGVQDLLLKPVDLSVLVSTVARHFEPNPRSIITGR